MIDSDRLLSRLRERVTERDDNSHCPVCHVMLTSTDREEAEGCTNCGASLAVDDESVDEELWDYDGDLNDWELGYDD